MYDQCNIGVTRTKHKKNKNLLDSWLTTDNAWIAFIVTVNVISVRDCWIWGRGRSRSSYTQHTSTQDIGIRPPPSGSDAYSYTLLTPTPPGVGHGTNNSFVITTIGSALLMCLSRCVPQRMMTKTNFGGLDEHRTIHAEFVAKIKGLSTPLDDATVTFAKQWWVVPFPRRTLTTCLDTCIYYIWKHYLLTVTNVIIIWNWA